MDMSGEAWALVAALVVAIGVVTLVFAIRMAKRLIITRRALGDLGLEGTVAFYGALIYTISPIDLLPDPIFLDDIGVLAAALFFLTNKLQERRQVPGRPIDR